jgi:hypothetical protein
VPPSISYCRQHLLATRQQNPFATPRAAIIVIMQLSRFRPCFNPSFATEYHSSHASFFTSFAPSSFLNTKNPTEAFHEGFT